MYFDKGYRLLILRKSIFYHFIKEFEQNVLVHHTRLCRNLSSVSMKWLNKQIKEKNLIKGLIKTKMLIRKTLYLARKKSLKNFFYLILRCSLEQKGISAKVKKWDGTMSHITSAGSQMVPKLFSCIRRHFLGSVKPQKSSLLLLLFIQGDHCQFLILTNMRKIIEFVINY